jgi:hypothetical protein
MELILYFLDLRCGEYLDFMEIILYFLDLRCGGIFGFYGNNFLIF